MSTGCQLTVRNWARSSIPLSDLTRLQAKPQQSSVCVNMPIHSLERETWPQADFSGLIRVAAYNWSP
jgi:hypothetical protein